MPTFKEVWQYTQGDRSFSEVYYSEADSLAAASTFDDAFITAAIGFRHSLTALRKIRVSSTENNRLSIPVNINRQGYSKTGGPDVVSTSAIVTIVSSATGSRRNLWLRGLKDTDVLRNADTGYDEPTGALYQAINEWIKALARNAYRIRSMTKAGVAPNNYSRFVSAVAVSGKGWIDLTTEFNHGWTAGQRIVISQASDKQFPGLNGHWDLMNASGTGAQVEYNPAVTGTLTAGIGRARREIYEYGSIDSTLCRFLKFGSRDTGKNQLGGRGRRSSRRLRSA